MSGKQQTMASNTTASSSCFDDLERLTRIAMLEIFLLLAFYVYVLCAMLKYERKIRTKSKLVVKAKSGGLFNIRIDDFAGCMRSCIIVAACAAIVRNICEQLEILMEVSSEDHCDVLFNCKYICGGIFFGGIYLFLWMRQRICYTNHAMKHLSTKASRCCSWFLVVFIIVTEFVVLALFVSTHNYEKTEFGCRLTSSKIPRNLPYILMSVGTIFFQVVLAFMFIYPLLKHKSKIHSSSSMSKYASYMALIKRTLMVLCIVVMIHIVVIILTITVAPIDQYNVTIFISYNINIVAHLLAAVMTYPNWTVRLLSFCEKGVDMSEYIKQSSVNQPAINVISLESGDKFVTERLDITSNA